MNTKLTLIIILIAGISSCTTMYKSGQTPDDVYYSPAIPQNDYVNVNNEEDRDTYVSNAEDREIRRKINNRRYRVYNDDYYSNIYNYPSPYSYNYPYIYSYPYNYSYYSPIYITPAKGSSPVYSSPRKFNLGAYGNTVNNATYQPNIKTAPRRSGIAPVGSLTNTSTNKSKGVGNFIRRVLVNSGNSNSGTNIYNANDNSIQNRSFQPARSTTSTTVTNISSSNNSSNGSSVPVRSFHK